MQISTLAAIVSAACLLSACGFMPPAPPKPSDSNRIAINHSDPRLYGQDAVTATAAPAVVATQITASGPVTPTGTPDATLASAAPAAQPSPEAVAVAPVPVPSAPEPTPQQAADVPAAPPATSPTATIAADPTSLEPAKITVQEPAQAVQTVDVATASTTPADVAKSEPPAEPPVIKRLWHISPSDGTVRHALTRWAAAESWTFGPDQWELNFDLPIQAPAEFEAESFQEATQALSQAIAMTESPVRPCFYANRVLRMIPFNRSCNRAPAASSH